MCLHLVSSFGIRLILYPPPLLYRSGFLFYRSELSGKERVAEIANSNKLDPYTKYSILYYRREDRIVSREEQRVHDLHFNPARIDPDLPQGG